MTDQPKRLTLKERGNVGAEWVRIFSAIIIAFTFLSSALTEVVGPGVKPVLQKFIGIEELRTETNYLSNKLDTIVGYIEPPKVVIWQRVNQLGQCTSESCEFDISFSRTAFGAPCGIPTVHAEMRLAEGFPFMINLGNFQPVQGTVQGTRVTVPLSISSRIPSGTYDWRVINTYPNCEFPGEPIPRKGPWWPVIVTQL